MSNCCVVCLCHGPPPLPSTPPPAPLPLPSPSPLHRVDLQPSPAAPKPLLLHQRSRTTLCDRVMVFKRSFLCAIEKQSTGKGQRHNVMKKAVTRLRRQLTSWVCVCVRGSGAPQHFRRSSEPPHEQPQPSTPREAQTWWPWPGCQACRTPGGHPHPAPPSPSLAPWPELWGS